MKICLRINLCISYCLILLSAIWFFFVVIINNRTQDPRISSLNLITPISESFSDGIYLRKIQLNQHYRDVANRGKNKDLLNIFELIEIMNDHSPNLMGDEVILIISITNEKLDLSSIKFAQYLYTKNTQILSTNSEQKLQKEQSADSESQQKTSQIPIYILRQTQPVLLNNQKNLLTYKQEIQDTLNYFVNILDIKKLSILSFQIGALLTLYSLAYENNAKIFNSLNKVVLINPFSLDIKIFHSPPIAFVEEQIKPAIIESNQKFNLFNNLRLIIISTTRTVFQQSKLSKKYFSFSFNKQGQQYKSKISDFFFNSPEKIEQPLYRFNNTFVISTRAMSNVFCFFDKRIYFFYEPFISLLSKFFVEDSKRQFSYQEMEYYFHYKELPEVKQLSERGKKKYIAKCVDFSLENYHYSGDTFGGKDKQNEECIRLLRKQSIYFEDSSILLYSKEKFQVYGENFEKIHPFESKTSYMVYHIQRVNQFRRLFIINRKSALIHMKIAPIFMPLTNPIVPHQSYASNSLKSDYSQLSFENLTNFQVVRTCQPANLIFPLHFAKMARFGLPTLLFTKDNNNQNCYTQYDNYDFYPDWFSLNWNILRNMMVFTLFVTQILGKSLIARFYTQSFVNQVIVWVSMGNLLLFQNFILLSSVCVIQTMLSLLMVGMQYLVNLRRLVVKFIWIPVGLQLASIYYPFLPSSWKILFLLIGLCTSKYNIFLIVIKLGFMIDSIRFDTRNIKGIVSICMWTYIAAFGPQDQQNTNNRLKKMIIDICFLFSIGVCFSEDGSVIDEIINAYIVMRTILYINNKYF